MTAQERIDAAIAARDRATPGPWVINEYWSTIRTESPQITERRTHGYGCDNTFIADLDDGEYHEYVNHDPTDPLDRLIAEAQEDYVDGHKQC